MIAVKFGYQIWVLPCQTLPVLSNYNTSAFSIGTRSEKNYRIHFVRFENRSFCISVNLTNILFSLRMPCLITWHTKNKLLILPYIFHARWEIPRYNLQFYIKRYNSCFSYVYIQLLQNGRNLFCGYRIIILSLVHFLLYHLALSISIV